MIEQQTTRPTKVRAKYPAYTYLLRFAARIEDLGLAEMLKDEMAATKATGGPEAQRRSTRPCEPKFWQSSRCATSL